MDVGAVSNLNYINNGCSAGSGCQNGGSIGRGLPERNAEAAAADTFVSSAETSGEAASSPAFVMTGADKYKEGSDVRELAYGLARCEIRGDFAVSDYTVLKAGDGDNDIKLSGNGSGSLIVDVDGSRRTFSASEAKKLIIDGGGGNDRIIADNNLNMDLRIVGGEGSDRIETGGGNDFIIDSYGSNYIKAGDGDDRVIANQLDFRADSRSAAIEGPGAAEGMSKDSGSAGVSVTGNYIDGGDGADYIEGGRGGDYIIAGSGNDVIYGLSGDDYIDGGDGRDYIDGGKGNDVISAGAGSDMVFGGRGSDTIYAGSGNNVIAGGRDRDTVNGGSGVNRIDTDGKDIITGGDNTVETVRPKRVSGRISVKTENEGYRERVESDLEALSSSSTGQKMLKGLAHMRLHSVKISPADGGNSCSFNMSGVAHDNGWPGIGCNSAVFYNRSDINIGGAGWGERPPVVGLYHELAHAYDAGRGRVDEHLYYYDGSMAPEGAKSFGAVEGAELQAVGIDIGSDRLRLNPEGISENSLRDYLGLERRSTY